MRNKYPTCTGERPANRIKNFGRINRAEMANFVEVHARSCAKQYLASHIPRTKSRTNTLKIDTSLPPFRLHQFDPSSSTVILEPTLLWTDYHERFVNTTFQEGPHRNSFSFPWSFFLLYVGKHFSTWTCVKNEKRWRGKEIVAALGPFHRSRLLFSSSPTYLASLPSHFLTFLTNRYINILTGT